jgi:hypothetical protein
MRSYRRTSPSWRARCPSDIGQATTTGLPVSSLGRGRSNIPAVCTSANDRNIICSSGRFTNLANRERGFRVLPSGEISIVSTTSPKVAAQASKWSMPRALSPSWPR